MALAAYYRLEDVFRIIDSGDPDLIWFSARSRSIYEVIDVFSRLKIHKDFEQARIFILEGMRSLKPEDFVQHSVQWGTITDVYGIIFRGLPWYVKFRIDESGFIEQISFHPPERDLKTVSGLIILKGFKK